MDMRKLMKQMQQAQTVAQQMQEELAAKRVEGSASGLVTVVADGQGKVQSISIKPEAADPQDIEALEDLLLVAIQDAQTKADDLQREATQSLGLPGMF